MQLIRRDYHIYLDIVFALSLGAICLWYLSDAYSASARTTNLILILPATITGALLAVIIAVESALAARQSRDADSASDNSESVEPPAIDLRSFAIMGCFVVYVLMMDRIGFDASTFLFVFISIIILGERNILLLLIYTSIFTIINVYIQKFTSYNIPLLIL